MRVLVVCALILAAGTSPASARTCRDMGPEGYAPTNIRVKHATCRTARRVAARVSEVPTYGGCKGAGRRGLFIHQPCRRLGYRCRGADLGLGVRVRCRKGHRLIRFDIAA